MNTTKEELKSKIMNIARDSNQIKSEVVQTDVQGLNSTLDPSLGGEMVTNEFSLYNLPPESMSELIARMADEYLAHYFYRNAANWCHDKNYKKAAAFFDAESANELEHALGLQTYMIGFNIVPEISPVDTKRTFTSLCEIIREAYKIELDLMMKYNTTSTKLFTSDLTTFDFLQTYRVGQKESVIEYNDLINAMELINEENKFEVLYFEQTYF